MGTWGQGPAAYSGYMKAGGPASSSGYIGEGIQLLTVGTWGPASYSGYMGQGVQLLTLTGAGGTSCLEWEHGGSGPTAYSGYMGQGFQLLTVGTWGRRSNCLQWVHGGQDPAAYSGYMYMYMMAGGTAVLFILIILTHICTRLVYTAQTTVYFTRIYHR